MEAEKSVSSASSSFSWQSFRREEEKKFQLEKLLETMNFFFDFASQKEAKNAEYLCCRISAQNINLWFVLCLSSLILFASFSGAAA